MAKLNFNVSVDLSNTEMEEEVGKKFKDLALDLETKGINPSSIQITSEDPEEIEVKFIDRDINVINNKEIGGYKARLWTLKF